MKVVQQKLHEHFAHLSADILWSDYSHVRLGAKPNARDALAMKPQLQGTDSKGTADGYYTNHDTLWRGIESPTSSHRPRKTCQPRRGLAPLIGWPLDHRLHYRRPNAPKGVGCQFAAPRSGRPRQIFDLGCCGSASWRWGLTSVLSKSETGRTEICPEMSASVLEIGAAGVCPGRLAGGRGRCGLFPK